MILNGQVKNMAAAAESLPRLQVVRRDSSIVARSGTQNQAMPQ
jgi:hypothetical protein